MNRRNYSYSSQTQETSFDLADTESLKDQILQVLKQIHKEKEEEVIKVDMWCHFGHAYVTKIDEGNKKRFSRLLLGKEQSSYAF